VNHLSWGSQTQADQLKKEELDRRVELSSPPYLLSTEKMTAEHGIPNSLSPLFVAKFFVVYSPIIGHEFISFSVAVYELQGAESFC
jgi:hypothetical protein